MKNQLEMWQYVAPLERIPRGGKQCFEVGGVSIIVCRIYADLFAVRNHCSHRGETMDAGRLQGYELICPHHGACFDIRQGQPVSGPAVTPLRTYPCREIDGDIYVLLAAQ